jgi:ABC-type lipoprotein release transport system permease subunit
MLGVLCFFFWPLYSTYYTIGARGLAHHLYEIDPHDPATLASAVALFALVAAAAAWWPARRAARVDPAVTLRQG